MFTVFCICFQNPYFLVLAFPFAGFEFLCLFSSLVVVSQIKLLCSGFCFLLFWVSWVCLCVMCCVFFWFLLFSFFGGFKGQVRWPKGPPQLTLNPSLFVLFCFCFVSVCFVLVVGFCVLCFCFCFLWKGFRVNWGGPLGHLIWPLNPA